jgi:hypothetical protein
MSAFVVQDRSINKIVAYLMAGDNRDAAEPFVALGYHLHDGPHSTRRDERRRLALDLFGMNCRAVDQRYDDHPARTEFHPEEFQSTLELPPAATEAVKLMGCLHYQCTEGSVPDEPLYKALEESQKLVALNAVESSPEYEALAWG